MEFCKFKELDSGDTFTLLTVDKGAKTEIDISENYILFVYSGRLTVKDVNGFTFDAKKGDFFVPSIGNTSFTSKSSSSVMKFRLRPGRFLCDCFALDALIKEKVDFDSDKSFILKGGGELLTYLKSLTYIIDGRLRCPTLVEVKVKELFLILMRNYSRQDLYKFFYRHITPDMHFSDAVYRHFAKARNMNELSAMLNYSTSGFQKHFKRVFGTPPSIWIKQQRIKGIMNDIMQQEMPIKEISEKYRFSSISHFYSFCKREFNKIPLQLRKQKEVGMDDVQFGEEY